MRVFGPSQPPYGFVRFCEGHAADCAPQRIEDVRFQPTPERLSELDEVNRWANRAVQPATDQEIYGVSELWTYPNDRGDCEDYALLKQKTLIARGWPKSSLLLTVVRDEKGEGHAVLTARTAQGDFVLDNKVDDVRLWNASGYYFIMRQSYLDPRVWVSLDANDRSVPDAIAGVGNGQEERLSGLSHYHWLTRARAPLPCPPTGLILEPDAPHASGSTFRRGWIPALRAARAALGGTTEAGA